jgi:hypothetical protein
VWVRRTVGRTFPVIERASIQRWEQFELCSDGIALIFNEFAVGGCGGEILWCSLEAGGCSLEILIYSECLNP